MAPLEIRHVEQMHLLALRFLSGGAATVASALAQAGFPELPRPGECLGADPWLVWRSPGECWIVGSRAEPSEPPRRALAAGAHSLCHALDLSAGTVAVELRGPGIDAMLARVIAAEALPRTPGRGISARLGEVRVMLLRVAADRLWILADRAHDRHLHAWLEHASMGAGAVDPGP